MSDKEFVTSAYCQKCTLYFTESLKTAQVQRERELAVLKELFEVKLDLFRKQVTASVAAATLVMVAVQFALSLR